MDLFRRSIFISGETAAFASRVATRENPYVRFRRRANNVPCNKTGQMAGKTIVTLCTVDTDVTRIWSGKARCYAGATISRRLYLLKCRNGNEVSPMRTTTRSAKRGANYTTRSEITKLQKIKRVMYVRVYLTDEELRMRARKILRQFGDKVTRAISNEGDLRSCAEIKRVSVVGVFIRISVSTRYVARRSLAFP